MGCLGHLGEFSDPLMDCKECHERFRADKIIEDYCAEKGIAIEGSVDAWSQEQMKDFIERTSNSISLLMENIILQIFVSLI